MRLNGRTWPVWVIVDGTVWFVAIAVFWALKPLHDHVPTTVAPTAAQIVVAQQAGQPAPGPQAGPTVEVECRTPAESSSRNLADEQATLAGLQDKNGVALEDGRFTRVPCVDAHRQAHILWYADMVLYLAAMAGMVTVLARRRRHHRHVPVSAFAAA